VTTVRRILSLPFAGLDVSQIDHAWVRGGGGVEANVFDGRDLSDETDWSRLDGALRHARDLGAQRLTLHFPTDHADWVNDAGAFEKLCRFCDVAAGAGATGVTLHSNLFASQDEWLRFDLADARKRVAARLYDLDSRLDGSPIWLGLENMPIIGSLGTDYDSVFVYPEDFAEIARLGSARIGVTWDVCHWALSYSLARSIAQLQQKPPPAEPLDLPPVPVRHVHFASFAGRAMPYWRGECVEGVPPQRGDADESLLAAMLQRALEAAPGDVAVVFEILEDDYLHRRGCWRTLEWVRSRPELDGLATSLEAG
jgi:sugar phosphate isomerase/epimerase